MNRQQRRNEIKKNKKLDMQVLKESTKIVRDKAIDTTQKLLLASTLIVLYDKHQMDAEQLKTILGQITSQCECIINHTVTLEEILQILKDETGIELGG